MSLLFSWFYSWFSHYIYINYHIRKGAQTTQILPHHHHHLAEFLNMLNNIFKLGTSFRHWKCWMFGFSDYLFEFVCIYCHFTIILQVRSTGCQNKCVIWTRIGRATSKSLFSLKTMTKQWRVPRIVWTPARAQTILGARHRLVIIFSENKDFYVALPILVQMTQFFLHHVLLTCKIIVKWQ